MIGAHCIKTWAKTQAVIAKSSAESELYAAVRGACEGLGAVTMLHELGVEMTLRIHIDSLAAKGIIERVGLHKVRHLDVDMLWLQSQTAKEMLTIHKVFGEDNTADLMTKNLTVVKIDKYMSMMGIVFRSGRSEKAAKLLSVGSRNVDGNEYTIYTLDVNTCGSRSSETQMKECDGRPILKGVSGRPAGKTLENIPTQKRMTRLKPPSK